MRDDSNPPILLRIRELAALLALSERACWKAVAAARLPRPLKIGRSCRWRRAEIEAWLAAGAPPTHRWSWEGAAD